jgi:integrase
MPRKRTGQVIEPSGGRSWSIRYTVNGKRYTETLPPDSTREDAQERLRDVFAELQLKVWKPPRNQSVVTSTSTFHHFATEWLEDREAEVKETTLRQYERDLYHLVAYFGDYPLEAIKIADVDDYRRTKLKEAERRRKALESGKPERRSKGQVWKPLNNNSINRTIQRLAQVLEEAVEQNLISHNPAKGRKRRAKPSRVSRDFLTADQVKVLLEAAAELDVEQVKRDHGDPQHRRAVIAALAQAGLRISEAGDLRWRDVDFAGHRLYVRESKTEAGIRTVDLMPDLRAELFDLKQRSKYTKPEDFVFATRRGNRIRNSTLRGRVWEVFDQETGELLEVRARGVLKPAAMRANERIERLQLEVPLLEVQEGTTAVPKLTPHGLRRTYAGLLLEAGAPVTYAMAQMGHTEPDTTLGIYARVVRDQVEVRDSFDKLVRGNEKAAKRQQSEETQVIEQTLAKQEEEQTAK